MPIKISTINYNLKNISNNKILIQLIPIKLNILQVYLHFNEIRFQILTINHLAGLKIMKNGVVNNNMK
jgi:hypothetical protein